MKESFQPLTDAEWEVIEKLLNDQRPRFYSLRLILDILFWLVWTGCQWREVNRAWGIPWQSAYYYFRKWKRNHFFDSLKDELLILRREQLARKTTPSAVAVDSQSIKKTAFVSLDTGIDGNKRINGRKRHLAVDTFGYPIVVCVTAANISDNEAGKTLADRLHGKLKAWATRHATTNRMTLIRADNGYKAGFVDYVTKTYNWLVDISQKPESPQGFVPQMGRWQVERSYGWLNFRRRLSKDYEKTVESSEAMLLLAFISFLIPNVVT
jgi:putative transposase